MVQVQQPVRMLFGLSKKIQSTRSWCMHKCHFLSPRCLRCQFHCCHPSVFVPPVSLLPPFSVCLCQCHLLVCAAHFIFCQPWHCTACSFLASCNVCTVKFHFLPRPVLRPQFHFLYPIVFAPVFVGQYFQCHFLQCFRADASLRGQTQSNHSDGSPHGRFQAILIKLLEPFCQRVQFAIKRMTNDFCHCFGLHCAGIIIGIGTWLGTMCGHQHLPHLVFTPPFSFCCLPRCFCQFHLPHSVFALPIYCLRPLILCSHFLFFASLGVFACHCRVLALFVVVPPIWHFWPQLNRPLRPTALCQFVCCCHISVLWWQW